MIELFFNKICERENFEIVKIFLDYSNADIDINFVENLSKRTNLHWAVYNDRIKIV